MSDVSYVELTPAQLRCLYLGPWFTGEVCPTDEPVRVYVDTDSQTITASYAESGVWDDDSSAVVIDRGGCMYASGPLRENPDEDTCEIEPLTSLADLNLWDDGIRRQFIRIKH